MRQHETDRPEGLPVGRESNSNTGSVRSEVLEGLLVGCTGRGGNHSGVRTESVGAGSLDSLDDVLLLLKVNKLVGAKLLTQGLLLGSGVNGDDTDSLEGRVPIGDGESSFSRLPQPLYRSLSTHWTARCPRPPPAPGMTIHSPAFAPDSLMAL